MYFREGKMFTKNKAYTIRAGGNAHLQRNILFTVLLMISLLSFFSLLGCSSGTSTGSSTSKEPSMTIDQNKQYTAVLKVIENGEQLGDITIQLLPEEAPHAVNNFVYLARKGFYNGLTFHRIIKDFMVQGGDPNGDGSGGPGYTIVDDKPITGDYVPGTLAMANTGLPNSSGSQFFITLTNLSDTTNKYHLPKDYVIFGLVTGGFDIVQKIGDVPVVTNAQGEVSKPTVDVHIGIITITES